MKFLRLSLLLLILSTIIMAGTLYYEIKVQKYEGPTTTFTIESGENFARVNHNLKTADIIHNSRLFHHYSKHLNALSKIRSGTFQIPHGVTMEQVLNILLYGKSIARRVTIPEGRNIYDIAQILFAKKLINTPEEFLRLVQDGQFINSLGLNLKTLEGRLFPDTYEFEKNISPEKIISIMVNEFMKKVEPLLATNSTHLQNNQIITLASIVEKETGAGFERPMIAGVFYNRLRKGMRLQSDPTTIYGMYPTYNGNIRKADLLEKTPYNTYAISGLPIGPICNPGIAAIEATLHPANHDYLYFVSQNDGTHIFSRTYEEHNKAVITYQKNRFNREGKSWRNLKAKETTEDSNERE